MGATPPLSGSHTGPEQQPGYNTTLLTFNEAMKLLEHWQTDRKKQVYSMVHVLKRDSLFTSNCSLVYEALTGDGGVEAVMSR